MLTSALKRVDTAVFQAIADAKNGRFKGGRDAVYGLDRNGVGIGRFSSKAPAGIAARVKRVEALLRAGKIRNIPTKVGS